MHLLSCIYDYTQFIKKTPYLYKAQQKGIHLFESFILANYLDLELEQFKDEILEEFLLLWLPRHKKYLTEIEAYDVVYTMQRLHFFLLAKLEKATTEETILDLYAREYMRLYRIKSLFNKVLGDPVLNMNTSLISLNAYAEKKEKKKEAMCIYEQGVFVIGEISSDGYIVLESLYKKQALKAIVDIVIIRNLKEGDIIHARLRRKVFFIYWEIDEILYYYLAKAKAYL